jgi:hypothetical protein
MRPNLGRIIVVAGLLPRILGLAKRCLCLQVDAREPLRPRCPCTVRTPANSHSPKRRITLPVRQIEREAGKTSGRMFPVPIMPRRASFALPLGLHS